MTSAKYRDPLNLDQHFRTCETSDGNQCTGRKIITEDLLSQLSKAVSIADVGDEHCHRDHISQGAAGLLECLTEPGKYLADLPALCSSDTFLPARKPSIGVHQIGGGLAGINRSKARRSMALRNEPLLLRVESV